MTFSCPRPSDAGVPQSDLTVAEDAPEAELPGMAERNERCWRPASPKRQTVFTEISCGGAKLRTKATWEATKWTLGTSSSCC